MRCPVCGGYTKVVDSRFCNGDIKRRRECLECARRFTTMEIRVSKSEAVRAVHRYYNKL